jgi:hypothetical protein
MAAGHSLASARWRQTLDELLGRTAGRFTRIEPRQRARAFVLGLRKLSTSVRQVDQGFVVPGVSSSGLLIHAAVGSWGGVGGLRTNRSGWAA